MNKDLFTASQRTETGKPHERYGSTDQGLRLLEKEHGILEKEFKLLEKESDHFQGNVNHV